MIEKLQPLKQEVLINRNDSIIKSYLVFEFTPVFYKEELSYIKFNVGLRIQPNHKPREIFYSTWNVGCVMHIHDFKIPDSSLRARIQKVSATVSWFFDSTSYLR